VRGGRTAEVGDLPLKYRPADWSAETDRFFSVAEELPLVEELPAFDELSIYLTEEQAATIVDPQHGKAPEPAALLAESKTANDNSFLPENGLDLRAHLLSIERSLITQALDRTGGTVAHAARLLHLRRTTLVEKLRKLGMLSGEVATED
jgi:DNA-binding NtrC family response regulator